MKKHTPNARDLAAILICCSFLILAGWLFLKYLFAIFIPFLLAWGLAFLVRPLARKVGGGTRIPERVLRLMFAVALFLAVGVAVWLTGARLVAELKKLLAALTAAGEGDLIDGILSRFPALQGGQAGAYLTRLLREGAASIASHLPTLLSHLMSGLPHTLIALTVTLIASVYFCLDLERIHRALLKILPSRMRAWFLQCKGGVFRVGSMYLKSYLTLMGVTFLEMLLGLALLRVEYTLLLAAVIALVDFFPILGVGTVLVPWSIWCFVTANPGRGIGLLILWGISLVVRQFLEPHLIGHGLGIHPCLTLFAMYTGLTLFGLTGMMIGPAFAALVCAWLPAFFGSSKHENENEDETREQAAPSTAEPSPPVKETKIGEHPRSS